MGIREALKWIRDLGIDNLQIENDCLQVILGILHNSASVSYLDLILDDIRYRAATTDERNNLFRSILTNSSNLSPSCKERVLATLLQNQELLDDLSTKESRNLLTLAQGIGATPWPLEESDDDVDEAELQAALEASKKTANVVFLSVSSSSGTDSLPIPVSQSVVSSLPSVVVCSVLPSSSCVSSMASPICSLNSVRHRSLRDPLRYCNREPAKQMEPYLTDFDVPPKHPSEEAQKRWRKAVFLVRNHRRRFCYGPNFEKRSEAKELMDKTRVFSVGQRNFHNGLNSISTSIPKRPKPVNCYRQNHHAERYHTSSMLSTKRLAIVVITFVVLALLLYACSLYHLPNSDIHYQRQQVSATHHRRLLISTPPRKSSSAPRPKV
nr:calcium-transporting ATPase 4, plasma membrane-type-like [Ipomoea batatas]